MNKILSCDICNHRGNSYVCRTCCNHYQNRFQPFIIPDGYLQCICCKKLVKEDYAFKSKDGDKTHALCFDCY